MAARRLALLCRLPVVSRAGLPKRVKAHHICTAGRLMASSWYFAANVIKNMMFTGCPLPVAPRSASPTPQALTMAPSTHPMASLSILTRYAAV